MLAHLHVEGLLLSSDSIEIIHVAFHAAAVHAGQPQHAHKAPHHMKQR